jgi:hypothetical protein
MKITPTGVNEALKSLQSNRFFPLSEMSQYPNLSGGTGFKPPPPPTQPKHTQRGRAASSTLPTGNSPSAVCDNSLPSFADVTASYIPRGRSPSVKRKDLEVSPNNNIGSSNKSKQARIDCSSSSNLKAATENLSMLEQVANDLLEATSSDPVLVAISARLCQGMITQNNILCSLISSNASCNHSGPENCKYLVKELRCHSEK